MERHTGGKKVCVRKRRWGWILAVLYLCFICGGLSVHASEQAVTPAVLERSCMDCHDWEKVCRKLDRKSYGAWMRTLKRMVNKHAADISPFGPAEVARYLSQPGEELLGRCSTR